MSQPVIKEDIITWEITHNSIIYQQTAKISNGIIEFDFNIPSGLKGYGEKMLDESLFIDKNISAIKAEWTMHTKYGTDRYNMALGLKEFWDYYDGIIDDPIRAAKNTRLGKIASDRGFNKISVDPYFDRDYVHVIFEKQ